MPDDLQSQFPLIRVYHAVEVAISIKIDELCIKNDELVLKMMDFVLKMMILMEMSRWAEQ